MEANHGKTSPSKSFGPLLQKTPAASQDDSFINSTIQNFPCSKHLNRPVSTGLTCTFVTIIYNLYTKPSVLFHYYLEVGTLPLYPLYHTINFFTTLYPFYFFINIWSNFDQPGWNTLQFHSHLPPAITTLNYTCLLKQVGKGVTFYGESDGNYPLMQNMLKLFLNLLVWTGRSTGPFRNSSSVIKNLEAQNYYIQSVHWYTQPPHDKGIQLVNIVSMIYDLWELPEMSTLVDNAYKSKNSLPGHTNSHITNILAVPPNTVSQL